MYDSWLPEDAIDAEPAVRRRGGCLENPRELTGREKAQRHARYRRLSSPKQRSASGMHGRRNKRYAL